MIHSGSAATNQVNDDILVEGGPPLRSHPAHVHDSLGVIGIHMEDGRIDNPSDISGVGGGAGHARVCSEADLRGKNHTPERISAENRAQNVLYCCE